MARRREIALKAALVRLEILYATRLARADKAAAAGFFMTTTGPRLYWCPGPGREGGGSNCAELDRLAEAQQAHHVAWKAVQMEQLATEKDELTARMTRRRDVSGGTAEDAGDGQDAAGGKRIHAAEHDDDDDEVEEALEREEREDKQQRPAGGERADEEPASNGGTSIVDAMDAAEGEGAQDALDSTE